MNLCIVSHYGYGALTGGANGHVGGVERQTSLMAKWFAARGHRVSFLTWDEGQPADCIVDGVRVIKMCRRSKGVRGVRFFYPRWTSLNKALEKADAEIYYQNCGEYVTGQVALWCRRNKRLFAYSTANDTDCTPELPAMHTIREKILYKYGLRHADEIITQTKKQQQMLINGFNLSSTVLPMPCPGPDTIHEQPIFTKSNPLRIGWAARISKEKRLELLVDVARKLPEVVFEIGGATTGEADDDYASPILATAAALPNVVLHGRIAREDMPNFYRKINLFCCTSAYEGFPNTFLEAWSHGLPIISTFDPDYLLSEHEIGKVAIDVDSLVEGVRYFIKNPEELKLASMRARLYYQQNHRVDEVMARFLQLFEEALKKTNETAEQ